MKKLYYYDPVDGRCTGTGESAQVVSNSTELVPDDQFTQRFDGEAWVTPVLPDPTPEELADNVRAERDALLYASDWTQVADAPVDQAAWAAYRQALREVPQQADFPQSVGWPEPPTA